MPVVNSAGRLVLAAAVCGGLLLTGCAAPRTAPGAAHGTHAERTATASPAAGAAAQRAPAVRPAELPGLGPATRSRVPATSAQALVVTGDGPHSHQSTAVLYERDRVTGWKAVSQPWPANNALRGWTANHRAGDLRTPIGVFSLGDAGGLLPDPGTRLPYDQSEEFNLSGTGFLGEPLEGSFDHVVAIDYNRISGTSPLNKVRPLGLPKGGGVWIHVDHGGPTRACISLRREHMRTLMRALDPAKNPVIVMGDVVTLAR
ncbi:L,D-transpeptidase family protein [Streptomyces ficellus]|uniref:L,D-transpeptidase family protein n=1 Tax=Streptomyces ficellus TaxID=1977088 RepID=A0ABT7Z330_9ACTN|nr:L,D-transpeptidase family protein [Streptomyces ficellus]MDN3293909.1 L,D-transpeptidase family protein [Streptomyces ficellus]